MKKKMTWFKHHNTASDGQTIQTLLAKKDHEAVALFWILIEICSRWSEQDEDGNQTGKVEIPLQVIATKMHMKPSRICRILDRISSVSQIDMEKKQDGNVSFLIHNFSELQERRGGFGGQKKTIMPGEVRSKKKDTPIVPKGDINHPFIKIWNDLVKGSFPLVEVLNKSRARALERCASIASVEDWTRLVQWAVRDDWLTGRKKGSDGKAFEGGSIDTIMRESKFVGYLERSKQGLSQQPKSLKLEDL